MPLSSQKHEPDEHNRYALAMAGKEKSSALANCFGKPRSCARDSVTGQQVDISEGKSEYISESTDAFSHLRAGNLQQMRKGQGTQHTVWHTVFCEFEYLEGCSESIFDKLCNYLKTSRGMETVGYSPSSIGWYVQEKRKWDAQIQHKNEH